MTGEVCDERFDQIGNGVALRHDRRDDIELLRSFSRHRSNRGNDRALQEVDGLLVAQNLHEVTDCRGAGERDRVNLAVEQHAVDVVITLPIPGGEDRPVSRHLHHLGPGLAQLVAEDFASDVGTRQQHA